jgi:radical SAM superfamily enzyme YgiQ (UPF0313 family)
MLALVNTNRMMPPIAPVGLEYVAGAVRAAGIKVDLLDLCLAPPGSDLLAAYFATHRPELVGLSFRNVDDCFWPSGASFVPELCRLIATLRGLTDAPIVLGGVGFSILSRQVLERSGADFGIRGDGEQATVELIAQLRGPRRWDGVPGLLWRQDGATRANRPAWPERLATPTARDIVDNASYFRRGGQIGVETKRGCDRQCIYCADPLAKGPAIRVRPPADVADEIESLLGQGVDVLHLCDAEFNIPADHAKQVCEEIIRRRLDRRVRWYAYLAVVPFDAELAQRMAAAGCVGINFTSDSASPTMLATYRQPHRKENLAEAVRLCRQNRIAVMLDLLLGGPGEMPETVADSIRFFQRIGPDCVGAALGLRLYPETRAAAIVADLGPLETNPGIRRHYSGPIDLLRPTFYISPAMGENPARLVRELIAGDPRFFEPEEETSAADRTDVQGDHNYNSNQALADAIAAGARGAYWDILRKLRAGTIPTP